MQKRRTWYAADEPGFHLLHTLFQACMHYEHIVRYNEWFVTTLLVDDGIVRGLVAVELATGRVETIIAAIVRVYVTMSCASRSPLTSDGGC